MEITALIYLLSLQAAMILQHKHGTRWVNEDLLKITGEENREQMAHSLYHTHN